MVPNYQHPGTGGIHVSSHCSGKRERKVLLKLLFPFQVESDFYNQTQFKLPPLMTITQKRTLAIWRIKLPKTTQSTNVLKVAVIHRLMIQMRGQETFPSNDQVVNISGFVASVNHSALPCQCQGSHRQMRKHECSCVLIKLHLQKQTETRYDAVGCSLPVLI